MKTNKKYKALIPLYNFSYAGNYIPTNKTLKIEKFDNPPSLHELEKELSSSECDDLSSTEYWLSFEHNKQKGWDTSNITILFLIALWLETPTETHARHLFEFSTDKNPEEKGFSRCLDRFQWNRKTVSEKITSDNITKAFEYFDLLTPLLRRNKRLKDALVMSAAACMSYRWQIAYISFSSAVETLLTYEKGPGLTNRLATSYACLVETNTKKRNFEYKKFKKLYEVRSDIIHGRIRKVAKTSKDKANKHLELLADVSGLLRDLWKKIITEKSLVFELEKSDASRKIFFNKIKMGYMPPETKKTK